MKARILLLILCTAFIKAYPQTAPAAPAEEYTTVYGFGMLDLGYNTNQVDAAWYDAARPSRLPAGKGPSDLDGNVFVSPRQSRLGVKTLRNTDMGELKVVIDFDMYGVGVDAGQTTIRFRHAYGQLGHFGAGLVESAFMDLDVFPNTFEYWGPSGMLFFRNAEFRWLPIMGKNELVFALDMPGSSADRGLYEDSTILGGLKPHYPIPDFCGHFKSTHDWGYFQLGFMLRNIQYEDLNKTPTSDLSDKVVGWGVAASAGWKAGKNDLLHVMVVEGAGVENYFNDAPIDIAAQSNSDPLKPVKGKALGNLGITAFLDHKWNAKWGTSIGYSTTIIDNSDLQTPNDFKQGQYIAGNITYEPVANVLTGFEAIYIDRTNKNDAADNFPMSSNVRLAFSFKYSFSQNIK